MHIERPRSLQIPRMKFTPGLMGFVPNPLDLTLRGHALPAELVSTPPAGHMFAPTNLLDTPSALLVRT